MLCWFLFLDLRDKAHWLQYLSQVTVFTALLGFWGRGSADLNT